MRRYCSDAIAIAQVAAKMPTELPKELEGCTTIEVAMLMLDGAERQLRHNENHQEVPKDCSSEAFDVLKLTDGPKS